MSASGQQFVQSGTSSLKFKTQHEVLAGAGPEYPLSYKNKDFSICCHAPGP
jgi:hypothetical protein